MSERVAVLESDVHKRAVRAYFRRFGESAEQPSGGFQRDGIYELQNVRGSLATYKVLVSDSGFRLQYMDKIGKSTDAKATMVTKSTLKSRGCPSTLETTCGVLVNSSAEPAATYSSGVYNPSSNLLLVVEPLLDAVSTTGWYLFADPRRVDTVEVTFLQGQETPVTNDWIDHETLSRNFTVIQTFNAKAIDHRGMVCHRGA